MTPTVIGPDWSFSGQSFWGSQAAALFSWEPMDFGLRSARVGQARSAEDKSQADLAFDAASSRDRGRQLLSARSWQTSKPYGRHRPTSTRWQVFNKSIHVLVDNQLRPGVDASRADAELARAKTQLYQAQQAERVALDTLASLMGTAGSEIQLDGGPPA